MKLDDDDKLDQTVEASYFSIWLKKERYCIN